MMLFILIKESVEVNEELSPLFTLSFFCKEMMIAAVDKYPSEYGFDKKALGPYSKMYVQKSWNQNVWTELPDTETFSRMIMEQMSQSSRVNINRELALRITFGQAKGGYEFTDEDEFKSYTCERHGESFYFSQNDNAHSPFEKK